MSPTPDELPNDIAALKQLLLAKTAELDAKTIELQAAQSGLVVTTLTIEKLKAQIAKFRREKFGSSSEKIERAIEQLELALEDAQAAKAEALAATSPASELTTDAIPPEPASHKKRRQLPSHLPRRDVVHNPDGICRRCGGNDLRQVGETVTEVLEYVPGRFEVISHVRPACSCRKCETMVQHACPTFQSRAASRGQACSPTSSRRSFAIIFHSTDRPRSSHEVASTSIVGF